MNIIIGKYYTPLELYAPILTTNTNSGEVVYSYSATPTATIFCYVNNRANNEVFNDMQRQSNSTIVTDCRYNDISILSINNSWIIKVNGNTYNVNSVYEASKFSRATVMRIGGIERT